MLKAVIDTSVFVAGYLSPSGVSHSAQIISRWRAGDFQLIMSPQILEEIVGKFIEKGIPDERVLEFIEATVKLALNIDGLHIVYRLDNIDPEDNMLLAAAQEAGADYLVSRDAKHLLLLKHHKGTQIVDPALFIRALDAEPKSKPETAAPKANIEETPEQRHDRVFQEELEAIRQKNATEA